MQIERAKRIEQIPPYLFAEIDKKKEELRQRGMDLIDLGIGDPDLPHSQIDHRTLKGCVRKSQKPPISLLRRDG